MLKYIALFVLSVTQLAWSQSGPITSGGGELDNAQPVSKKMVEHIYRAKVPSLLNVVINSLYSDYAAKKNQITGEAWDIFFKDRDTLFRLISSPRIFLNSSDSCYDRNGVKKDASIFTPTGDDICLSTKAITGKVSEIQIAPRLVALVAHEYSHLVGNTTEEQADLIQYHVLYRASQLGDHQVALEKIRSSLDKLNQLMDESYALKNYENPKELCRIFSQMTDFVLPDLTETAPNFSAFNPRSQVEVDSLAVKLNNFRKQACIESKELKWQEWQRELDSLYSTGTVSEIDAILKLKSDYYRYFPTRVFPVVRRVGFVVPPGGNIKYLARKLIEQREIEALIMQIFAQVDSVFWL